MYGGATAVSGLDSIRFRGYGSTNAMLVDNVTLNESPEPPAELLTGSAPTELRTASRARRVVPSAGALAEAARDPSAGALGGGLTSVYRSV